MPRCRSVDPLPQRPNGRGVALPTWAYHLTLASNLPSIERYGLLSTSALRAHEDIGAPVSDTGAHGASGHRPTRLTLADGVTLNDQAPMPPAALVRCVVGMTPDDWYALVDTRVFFWLDRDRLTRLRHAARATAQALFVVDIASLLARHGARAAVTPINTGNARRRPALRGRATFVPLATWYDSAWASEARDLGTPPRPRSHPPAELTVEEGVPDLRDHVVAVHLLGPGESLERIEALLP